MYLQGSEVLRTQMTGLVSLINELSRVPPFDTLAPVKKAFLSLLAMHGKSRNLFTQCRLFHFNTWVSLVAPGRDRPNPFESNIFA